MTLLRALARFRLARTSDLVALAFADVRRDTAGKRLRRLFDAGYLDVVPQRRTDENVYTLGPQGKRWIEASGGRVSLRPAGGLEHHLAIVSAWVGLAVAAHESSNLQLASLRPDWDVRQAARANGASVVPDALVELRVVTGRQSARLHLALEVDLGTEPSSVLREKLGRYRDLLDQDDGLFGWRDFGLAIVLGDAGTRRRSAIERLLERHWPGWWVLWTDKEGLRVALESLVEAVGAPLTSSPSARGGEAVQPPQ
jgi:hypothetical protein